MNALYFILFIGGLIFFHELGHFLAARAVGVSVVRFSIGFGPRLLGFRRGGTDYCLSAFPLGGYVKFLGDDPDEPLPPDQVRSGFLTTDIWRRVLIVLAGPCFNLVLPLLVFLPTFAMRSELPPSTLGTVGLDGPAWAAGLRPGDHVTAIDGRPVRYFWELQDAVTRSPGTALQFTVERDGGPRTLAVVPASVDDPVLREVGFHTAVGQIEVTLEASRPVVVVTPGSPAATAGIRDFDAVLAVDGKALPAWDDVAAALQAATTRAVHLQVAATSRGSSEPGPARDVTFGPLADGAATGLADGSPVVAAVDAGTPAQLAGLQAGDRILEVDGHAFAGWLFLVQSLEREPDASHDFHVRRGDADAHVAIALLNPAWRPGAAVPRYAFGAEDRRAVVIPADIPNDERVTYALDRSWGRTKKVFAVTVGGLAGLFTGRVSLKEMGGPIMIYHIASTAGQRGWAEFFESWAWLSMSLGVLNLLPVPVLDGGHLVLFGIEAVRRRPVGRKGRQAATYFGLAFLMLLMALVFVNDIERTWGALSDMGPK
jgi:regulator of sigma E protease